MSSTFRPLRARSGISLFFFTNGAMMAGLLPRYPEVKAAFGLTNTEFGLMVAIGPLASMLASSLPAPLIRRFGARRVAMAGTLAMAAAIATAGFAPGFVIFATALGVAGFSDAITDAAQNVHALRVEDRVGRTIINSLHALWSLGATTGGIVGAFAASRGVPLGIHLMTVAIVLVGLAALATWMGQLPPVPQDAPVPGEEPDKPSTRLPAGTWTWLAPLVLLAVAGILVEDVAQNWSALYLVQTVGVSTGIGGIGYVVMLAAHFAGRIFGDAATDRWGRVAVIKMSGAAIMLGGALIIAMPGLILVLVGYALAGYGCSVVVPAAYAAAGRLPGLPEGAGITYVSWLMRVGFLATSPIIGAIGDLTSLRVGLGLIVLAGLAVVVLAKSTRPNQFAS